MANRRPQGGRRMDFGRNDRGKGFRPGVSPWQGGAPGNDIPNLLPLAGGSTEATLALASNIINLLQPRQNPVPSLLDMPIRRDFGPSMGRYDRNFGPNRMGNQGNFRRSGNYNRAGERMNNSRKPFRPNDGQRQQNKSSPKKEADPKNRSKESDQDKKDIDSNEKSDNKEEVKKEAQKTRYDDINPQLLKCHICNKSMWDGRSFENHLSGRAHAIMMQKTGESYALTADTMRQEFKIREMKRTRKSGQQMIRDFYCAMCDMYAADGSAHRTTVGHRKLKKYLHPTCTSCHKEMPTRIELDEHRLTPGHLRMMQEKQEVVGKPKPEVMVISTLHTEQLYLRDDRQRFKKQSEEKDKDSNIKVEKNQEGDEKQEGAESSQVKESIDNEDTILDYKEGDDVTDISSDRYPEYSTDRGVGESFLTEFRCIQCTLCKKLLDSRETAAVHLRTWRHHQLFVRLLADRAGREPNGGGGNLIDNVSSVHFKQSKQETEPVQKPHQDKLLVTKGAKKKRTRYKKSKTERGYSFSTNTETGSNMDAGNKRPRNSEESGSFKRRKTSPEPNDDDHTENGHDDADKAETKVKMEVDDNVEVKKDDNGEADIPNADDLEDWEQSVDEILRDVKQGNDAEENQE